MNAAAQTVSSLQIFSVPTPLHPTPQFARPGWLDLNGPWAFGYDDDNTGLDQGWECQPNFFDRTIQVPFAPESPASGVNETGMHPVMWYRKTFCVEKPADRQRLLLHFGAVDYLAMVWVNGIFLGQHQGGNTPFTFDATRALIPSAAAEQVVVVRAEDQPLDMAQPRGKQDWQNNSHGIWYQRTSGIWQSVWLEWVAGTHIDQLRWTPSVPDNRLCLALKLNRKPAQALTLRVRLSMRGAVLADDSYRIGERELSRDIHLPVDAMSMERHRYLWSPEFPNLIDAQVSLMDEETVLDEISSYAGLRSAGLDSGQFLLNGMPYYPRMVLEQGYWHESCLTAPNDEALRKEVELIKSLGFNGARIHQKVEDPRFLYWCDRLGLLVWGEMSNAYVFSSEAAARMISEWTEVLQRDYNHPCIVTWVPLNESWGAPTLAYDERQRAFVRTVYSLTKTFDSTRPVIDNDGWEHVESDILSLHDYAKAGATLQARYGSMDALRETLHRGRPIGSRFALDCYQLSDDAVVMLTEFGGLSYHPQEGTPWFGYGTVANQEEYLAGLEDLIQAVLACSTIAGFCYTQLTDTEQETNGLLTADRQPKFPLEIIRKIITMPRRG